MTMDHPLLLSVNVDHIATIRQARGAVYPDPVEAAAIAEDAGAHGITVHLRGDRRHIQTHDVERLRPQVRGKLNLEIAATEEMLTLAERLHPGQVTLVPERPEEITTEGGLDMVQQGPQLKTAIERLRAKDIAVSLFLDPSPEQVEALATLGPELVPGFEINTDAYTRARGTSRDRELSKVKAAADQGAQYGFQVFAGHGLTTENVVAVAAIPQIEELNIGHWLVSRGALVGLGEAIREMLGAMAQGRQQRI